MDDLLDHLMIALAIIWIVLLVQAFTVGLGPFSRAAVYLIWRVFLFDFAPEILIAPARLTYLRHHWLTAVSLLLPALGLLRIFRVLSILRAAPS